MSKARCTEEILSHVAGLGRTDVICGTGAHKVLAQVINNCVLSTSVPFDDVKAGAEMYILLQVLNMPVQTFQ